MSFILLVVSSMADDVGIGVVEVVVVVVVGGLVTMGLDFVILGKLRTFVVDVVGSSAPDRVRKQQTSRAKMRIAGKTSKENEILETMF